jgi:dTMP kinase
MFVTFEGPEGGGKSTMVQRVAAAILADGQEVVTTREPGAGETGQRIRELLLHGPDMPPETELLLFLADRANHVRTVIRPALEAGKIVLCDRFADSTWVYQAYVRELDRTFVEAGNQFATGGLEPDLTILLDLEPEIGMSRFTSRDRIEAQPIEFHKRIREGFILRTADSSRWVIIDASQPEDAVFERVWHAIQENPAYNLRRRPENGSGQGTPK